MPTAAVAAHPTYPGLSLEFGEAFDRQVTLAVYRMSEGAHSVWCDRIDYWTSKGLVLDVAIARATNEVVGSDAWRRYRKIIIEDTPRILEVDTRGLSWN